MARTLAVAACVFALACSDSGKPAHLELQAVGGVHSDGSGRPGLALLATFRSPDGMGPATAWSGTVSDPLGEIIARPIYDAASPGSFALWSWPGGGSGAASGYELAFSSEDERVRVAFNVPSASALDVPRPTPTRDGAALTWPSIPGAATYVCRLIGVEGTVLDAMGADASCDVSALPAGAYAVSAIATSLDLGAIADSTAQRPDLPSSFVVTEGRLGLLRRDELPAITLQAAGGALDWNLQDASLAIWVSIAPVDGSLAAEEWDVAVTGPGLPGDAPLSFRYPAGAPRLLVWSYEVPAAPGLYTVTATSAVGTVRTQLAVGEPAHLPFATDVVATAEAQGGVHAAWSAVADARAYFVSVYSDPTAADPVARFVAGQWVDAAVADWPPGAFTAGVTYQVYVAATDADMLGGDVPLQVSLTEDTYAPARFVAR